LYDGVDITSAFGWAITDKLDWLKRIVDEALDEFCELHKSVMIQFFELIQTKFNVGLIRMFA